MNLRYTRIYPVQDPNCVDGIPPSGGGAFWVRTVTLAQRLVRLLLSISLLPHLEILVEDEEDVRVVPRRPSLGVCFGYLHHPCVIRL